MATSSKHIEDCEPDVPQLDVIYLDHDPILAAKYMADQHLHTALHAACVLLSNAWWTEDAFEKTFSYGAGGVSMHPGGMGLLYGCLEVFGTGGKPKTRADAWVQSATMNYVWLWRHAMGLCMEIAYRFGGAVVEGMTVAALELPPLGIPPGPQTEPPVARENTRVVDSDGFIDAVLSFRKYYKMREMQITWTVRDLPPWVE